MKVTPRDIDGKTFEYDSVVVRHSINQPSLETRYCNHAWRLGDENERTLSGGLAMPAVYVCAFCGLHCTPYWVSTEYDAQVGLVVTSPGYVCGGRLMTDIKACCDKMQSGKRIETEANDSGD